MMRYKVELSTGDTGPIELADEELDAVTGGLIYTSNRQITLAGDSVGYGEGFTEETLQVTPNGVIDNRNTVWNTSAPPRPAV